MLLPRIVTVVPRVVADLLPMFRGLEGMKGFSFVRSFPAHVPPSHQQKSKKGLRHPKARTLVTLGTLHGFKGFHW